jgi:hypothetical protein
VWLGLFADISALPMLLWDQYPTGWVLSNPKYREVKGSGFSPRLPTSFFFLSSTFPDRAEHPRTQRHQEHGQADLYFQMPAL